MAALPFLSNSEVFLFPIVAVLVVYVFNFVGYPFGLGFNASRIIAYVSIARHVSFFMQLEKIPLHIINSYPYCSHRCSSPHRSTLRANVICWGYKWWGVTNRMIHVS